MNRKRFYLFKPITDHFALGPMAQSIPFELQRACAGVIPNGWRFIPTKRAHEYAAVPMINGLPMSAAFTYAKAVSMAACKEYNVRAIASTLTKKGPEGEPCAYMLLHQLLGTQHNAQASFYATASGPVDDRFSMAERYCTLYSRTGHLMPTIRPPFTPDVLRRYFDCLDGGDFLWPRFHNVAALEENASSIMAAHVCLRILRNLVNAMSYTALEPAALDLQCKEQAARFLRYYGYCTTTKATAAQVRDVLWGSNQQVGKELSALSTDVREQAAIVVYLALSSVAALSMLATGALAHYGNTVAEGFLRCVQYTHVDNARAPRDVAEVERLLMQREALLNFWRTRAQELGNSSNETLEEIEAAIPYDADTFMSADGEVANMALHTPMLTLTTSRTAMARHIFTHMIGHAYAGKPKVAALLCGDANVADAFTALVNGQEPDRRSFAPDAFWKGPDSAACEAELAALPRGGGGE